MRRPVDPGFPVRLFCTDAKGPMSYLYPIQAAKSRVFLGPANTMEQRRIAEGELRPHHNPLDRSDGRPERVLTGSRSMERHRLLRQGGLGTSVYRVQFFLFIVRQMKRLGVSDTIQCNFAGAILQELLMPKPGSYLLTDHQVG